MSAPTPTAMDSKVVDVEATQTRGQSIKSDIIATELSALSIADGKILDEDTADIINAENEYTPEYYKKLLRRIDLFLLPVMWICYGTQQADKTAISTQSIFGIIKDTGMKGQQFAWLTTIFYIAYLVCEGPANYLIQRVKIGSFLAAVMFLWGVVVLCTGFAENWPTLMALRALQGALECTISPTFLFITGTWYTSREHTMRSIIWGTANAGMNIISGLINYGIGFHAQRHPGGLAAWKGISYFLGTLTILDSILVFFFLGTPREVRWLSEDQKRAAAARVLSNQTGSDRKDRSKFKWDQALETFKDPQTYFFFFVTIINALPNGANTTFGKLVWVSFGFSNLDTLLKGSVPQYCFSIVWFLIVGITTLKKPNLRFILMMGSLVPAFVGMLTLALLPSKGLIWTRWAMYMMTVFGQLPGLLIWTFLPSNVAGRTKKSVTATLLFVGYCVGNAVGAQVMQAKDAPRYITGITVCASMYGLEFLSMGLWRTYYIWQNKRRARMIAESGISEEDAMIQGRINAEADMTDFDNIYFKYQV